MADQVGEMITQIATAATQSAASAQINNNLEQIAAPVRDLATGAQDAEKSCQYLSRLALEREETVSNFKLDRTRRIRMRRRKFPTTG